MIDKVVQLGLTRCFGIAPVFLDLQTIAIPTAHYEYKWMFTVVIGGGQ